MSRSRIHVKRNILEVKNETYSCITKFIKLFVCNYIPTFINIFQNCGVVIC